MYNRDEQQNEEMLTKKRPASPVGDEQKEYRRTAMGRPAGSRSIREAREAVRSREAAEEGARRPVRTAGTARPEGSEPRRLEPDAQAITRPTGRIPADKVQGPRRAAGTIPAEQDTDYDPHPADTARPPVAKRPTAQIPAEGVRRATRPTGRIPAEGVRRTTRSEGATRPTEQIPAEGVRRTVRPEGAARPTGQIPTDGVRRTTRPTGQIPTDGVRRTTRPTGQIPTDGVRRTTRPTGQIPTDGVRRATRPTGQIPAEGVRRTAQNRPTVPDRDRNEKKSGGSIRIIIGIVAVLAVLAVAGVILFKAIKSGDFGVSSIKATTVDLNEYYELGEGEARLVLNGVTNELRGYVGDGEFYAPYELVQGTLNNRIYYDRNEQLLLYTLDSDTIEIALGESSYTRDGAQVENGAPVVVMNGETPFISMTFVKAFTNLEYSTFTDPSRLVILQDGITLPAAVAKACEVKETKDNNALNMTVLEKGDPVWIMEEGETWSHVMSEKGIAGYVKTKKLSAITEKTYSFDMEEPVFTSIHRDHTIRMAWHQVMGMGGNDTLSSVISGASINTIAPTWFFLTDTDGNVASLASSDYVQTAHASGLEVWAVVNDFDGEYLYSGPNSAEQTLDLLSYTSKRRRLEETIVNEVVNVGADGINVDFEKVNEECGSHYIQFIRELSVLCGRNGLVLSVDSYVPSAWTTQYHRDEQSKYADYVVIMAYDENGSWSTEIGPNSSLNYVEDAIHDTLKVVDADKMILGIPFYTRLWWESEDPAEAITNGFSCNTQTMQEQAYILDSRVYDIEWDELRGTNRITYNEGGNKYTMWVEDADSLKLKLDCMQSNGLAGFSAWKLGQETSDVWAILGQY